MALNFDKAPGNTVLKNAESKNAEKLNIQKAINISIDELVEDELNDKTFNMENIDGFAESIKEVGFHGVLEVYEREDGKYQIIAGHRRYRAAKKAGLKHVPCVIEAPISKTEIVKRELESNIFTRNKYPLDTARSIDRYIKDVLAPEGIKNAEIDRIIEKKYSISSSQLKRYKTLLKLIPELQELANDPEYPFSAFMSAVRLSDEEQRSVYNEIIASPECGKTLNRTDINGIIKKYLGVEEINVQKDIEPEKQVHGELTFEKITLPTKTIVELKSEEDFVSELDVSNVVSLEEISREQRKAVEEREKPQPSRTNNIVVKEIEECNAFVETILKNPGEYLIDLEVKRAINKLVENLNLLK